VYRMVSEVVGGKKRPKKDHSWRPKGNSGVHKKGGDINIPVGGEEASVIEGSWVAQLGSFKTRILVKGEKK